MQETLSRSHASSSSSGSSDRILCRQARGWVGINERVVRETERPRRQLKHINTKLPEQLNYIDMGLPQRLKYIGMEMLEQLNKTTWSCQSS